ncbi:hypothetical protein GCK32_006773 [Trichostrongylus colubriformis]|uniref:Uncharacterized protein n=1 Tax=Trichostrongylus colubriformis TaxID=6319 RepID=A0AAN8FTX7_TRICO
MVCKKKFTLTRWQYWRFGVEGDEKFDFNVKSIGFYVAFLRLTDDRKNESPVTNVFLMNQTEFDGTPLQPGGTAFDFSTMYNVSPIVPYFDLVDINNHVYVSFDANCNQTRMDSKRMLQVRFGNERMDSNLLRSFKYGFLLLINIKNGHCAHDFCGNLGILHNN